jgi:phosphoribosylformimino-5-aminoimidazole carboxamide ribotide isomerase
MELIPVLDLRHGVAVHARRGDRERYRPVVSTLVPGLEGDALALAAAYRRSVGARHCYLADLDAIDGRAPQHALLAALADPARGFGAGLLVDAGVGTAAGARALLAAGAETVVVGLETLAGFGELGTVVSAAGSGRTAFSLDLRDGQPVVHPAMQADTPHPDPYELAARAQAAGVATIIVLDLRAVGSEAGPRHLELLTRLKRGLGVRLLAGGGVRSAEDLVLLRDAGADGALVASALHSGAIGPARA